MWYTDGSRIRSNPVLESLRVLQELALQSALGGLASRNTVMLRWVPEHRGLDGDENPDRSDIEGALSSLNGLEPAVN